MKRILGTLTLLTLVATLAAASAVPCEKVKGTGNTYAISQFEFAGSAQFDDGRIAQVNTQLLGPPRVTDDGTLQAQTSHTFTFTDGSSITTLDRAILSPITSAAYDLNTKATVTDGTGQYADATGKLTIHGTIDFAAGSVVWRFSGQFCGRR